MPRRQKGARDMTTDELARRVFHPKVLKELKKTAHGPEKKPARARKSRGKSSP